MIKRLVLPDVPFPLEQSVDSVCRFALRFLEDLGQRKGAVIIGEGVEDEMNVVWHYNETVERAFCPIEMQTRFDDNSPRRFRKMPSMVGCERAEDCFVIFLKMRKGSAILVLSLHQDKLALNGKSSQCPMDTGFVMKMTSGLAQLVRNRSRKPGGRVARLHT
jgi:hypothetical protein